MAKSDKNTLKSWFQNGDYPNQEQFWSWMDSYWHKDDQIPISVIIGLADLIAGKATHQDIVNLQNQISDLIGVGQPETVVYNSDGSHLIMSGQLLEKIVLMPTGDITFSLGTGPGVADIMIPQDFPGGKATAVGIDFYAFNTDDTVYLNGITSQTTVKFYTR